MLSVRIVGGVELRVEYDFNTPASLSKVLGVEGFDLTGWSSEFRLQSLGYGV